MTRPLVSICIPCFNAERYVGAAIESVLSQTYAPIEIIVVDDGSTDGSATVIEGFAGRGVRLISGEQKGAAAARNRAFAASSGDLILYLDADDLIASGHVAALAGKLDGGSGQIAYGRWARFKDIPGEISAEVRSHYRDIPGVDWLYHDWVSGHSMAQCGMFLISRQLVERLGGWDESLSLIDDFEFFARLLATCSEMKFAPEACLYYRSGLSESLSGQTTPKAALSACNSLLLGTAHLLAAEDSPRTRRACANALRTFEYDFYPRFPELRARIESRVAELGGATLEPVGPPRFHMLRRFIGWRAARRLQILAERMGINRAARRHSGNRH